MIICRKMVWGGGRGEVGLKNDHQADLLRPPSNLFLLVVQWQTAMKRLWKKDLTEQANKKKLLSVFFSPCWLGQVSTQLRLIASAPSNNQVWSFALQHLNVFYPLSCPRPQNSCSQREFWPRFQGQESFEIRMMKCYVWKRSKRVMGRKRRKWMDGSDGLGTRVGFTAKKKLRPVAASSYTSRRTMASLRSISTADDVSSSSRKPRASSACPEAHHF